MSSSYILGTTGAIDRNKTVSGIKVFKDQLEMQTHHQVKFNCKALNSGRPRRQSTSHYITNPLAGSSRHLLITLLLFSSVFSELTVYTFPSLLNLLRSGLSHQGCQRL